MQIIDPVGGRQHPVMGKWQSDYYDDREKELTLSDAAHSIT